MKKLLFLLSTLLICNIASAQISQYTDDFVGSKNFISILDKKKTSLTATMPKSILLKKELFPTGYAKYTLFLVPLSEQTISPLEATVFKLNNDNNKLYYFKANTDYSHTPYASSFEVTNSFIEDLKTAQTLTFQVPLTVKNNLQAKYFSYNLDATVLDEWKQIISMQ